MRWSKQSSASFVRLFEISTLKYRRRKLRAMIVNDEVTVYDELCHLLGMRFDSDIDEDPQHFLTRLVKGAYSLPDEVRETMQSKTKVWIENAVDLYFLGIPPPEGFPEFMKRPSRKESNAKVLDRTIAAIEASQPERVRMAEFFIPYASLCDTAACIAGWVALANYQYEQPWLERKVLTVEDLRTDVDEAAAQVLELTPDEEQELFYMFLMWKNLCEVFDKHGLTDVKGIDLTEPYPAVPILTMFDAFPAKFRKKA